TSLQVEKNQAAIGDQYQAVANGKIDAMVMAWLPDTHRAYWKKVHDKVVDLGPLYNGAVVGWAVPTYVAKAMAASIPDLKKRKRAEKFGAVIHGIAPDAGEMQASEKTMTAYGLKDHYTLESGSGQSMIQALLTAENDLAPILVTLWTPHWAFAKWHLRFLADPDNVFGGPQHVDAV